MQKAPVATHRETKHDNESPRLLTEIIMQAIVWIINREKHKLLIK